MYRLSRVYKSAFTTVVYGTPCVQVVFDIRYKCGGYYITIIITITLVVVVLVLIDYYLLVKKYLHIYIY